MPLSAASVRVSTPNLALNAVNVSPGATRWVVTCPVSWTVPASCASADGPPATLARTTRVTTIPWRCAGITGIKGKRCATVCAYLSGPNLTNLGVFAMVVRENSRTIGIVPRLRDGGRGEEADAEDQGDGQ